MRTLNRLTAIQVTRTKKPGVYSDGGGLYLQISRTLAKSWFFRYMRQGKARGMGLGPVHTVSLVEARIKALDCRRQLVNGIDPLDDKLAKRRAEKREQAKSLPFRDCAGQYIEAHRQSRKNGMLESVVAVRCASGAQSVAMQSSLSCAHSAAIRSCCRFMLRPPATRRRPRADAAGSRVAAPGDCPAQRAQVPAPATAEAPPAQRQAALLDARPSSRDGARWQLLTATGRCARWRPQRPASIPMT